MMRAATLRALFHAASAGALHDNPGRFFLALLGIALGVSLGVAVHLINASALNEFSLAVRGLTGKVDLVIRGPRAGFAEELYPKVARLPQVQAVSPAVEIDVPLSGSSDRLKLIGIDPFRMAMIQPALLAGMQNQITDLLDPDAVLLSHAAADWLGMKAGDTLRAYVGTTSIELKVAGLLPPSAYRQRLGVMDIASAQWRLARLGRLNRIDLRLHPGVDIAAFRHDLATLLPAGVIVTTPDVEVERSASVSRAYRLNLDMLALVALFTGAFLVYSTQVLSVLRRRTHFALLRVTGLTRLALVRLLVAEGALMGVAGSTLGVVLGYGVAAAMLKHFGTDLGAGYFDAISPALHVEPGALALFWLLGIAFCVLGATLPAIEAGRRAPALALKAKDEEESFKKQRAMPYGMALIGFGLACTQAPALTGLPLLGYLAIALILLGTILILPWLVAVLLPRLPAPRFPPALLATAQLKASPRHVAISITAIVTSFSLMVAMLIMVGSFRNSLDHWLTRVLPADLYLRAARGGETGFFTSEEQARIAGTPGVASVRFLRSQNLLLGPDRPPISLLARPVDAGAAHHTLPLTGPSRVPRADEPPPVWVSEIAADLFQYHVGDHIILPIGGQAMRFTVAGIWRDYARQTGAAIIDRDLYIRITGDTLANDAALWLAAGASLQQTRQALRERLRGADGIDIAETREIRATSLAIFDRTFAITYALEIVAVLIGLFGVSVSFSAQALARRREFGVLRHVGMTRREIGIMLGCEGIWVAGLGVGVGLALGWVISLILIHVINRQSFHWSMDLHLPWLALAGLAAALVAAASATAVWSGRRAMDRSVLSAVREDW
ncbi:MAG: ABC transporter permease [Burkholderiales bacterium]|nr:ABC transporter permease [Burkholderiales bacterium]